MHRILAWFLVVLAAGLPAAGQILPTRQVPPAPGLPAADAGLPLLGDLGDLIALPPIALPGLATLTVSFEEGTGLDLLNLGAGAWPINPRDPSLLARLPSGVTIAPELPLLIRIEPPPAGGLSFEGITVLDVLAPTLSPSANASRRLFAAPTGGLFADITDIQTVSTYRLLGSRGGFSEFLVVDDPTPLDQVIADKLLRLSGTLATHAAAIPAPVRSELAARLAAVEAQQALGNTAAALAELESFLATVEAHSGSDIPDVWRAARDLVNVAGELRAAARTLRFSLRQDLGP